MNVNFRPGRDRSGMDRGNQGDGRGSAFCNDWRCQDCQRLLGKDNGAQMQIRRKPLDYVVGFPVYATCPGCGALNAKIKA
jgi:hypothetical protein